MQNPWEEIKDQLNIVDVINEYVTVKQLGSSYKCVCPFHQDKNPSLTISPEKGLWHCFGCGAGGDMFKFVMDFENISKKEALEKLAQKANIKLEPIKPKKALNSSDSLQNQEELEKNQISTFQLGLKYLNWTAEIYHKILIETLKNRQHPVTLYCLERGLNSEIVETFRIGFAPKGGFMLNLAKKHKLNLQILEKIGILKKTENNEFKDKFSERLVLPIFDKQAKVVGFTARNFPFDKFERPKYLNSPQTEWFSKSKIWYGWHLNSAQVRKQKKAIIVEGNMDVIAAYLAGLDYCLASQGTSFSLDQIKILKTLTKTVWLAFDNDEAGFSSGKKFFKIATSLGLEVEKLLIPNQFKDLDEWLKSKPENLQNLQVYSKFYLDYFLAKIQQELASDDLKIQKQSLLEILDLLTACDDLTKEHYLQKISKINKKSLHTLNLELQKLAKNQNLEFQIESQKEDIEAPKTVSAKQLILVNWQNLVSKELSLINFELEKTSELATFKKLQNLFFILKELLGLFTDSNSFEIYLTQNLKLFEMIFSQNPNQNQIQLWQILSQFVDNQSAKLFLDENLKNRYLEFKTTNNLDKLT